MPQHTHASYPDTPKERKMKEREAQKVKLNKKNGIKLNTTRQKQCVSMSIRCGAPTQPNPTKPQFNPTEAVCRNLVLVGVR